MVTNKANMTTYATYGVKGVERLAKDTGHKGANIGSGPIVSQPLSLIMLNSGLQALERENMGLYY